MLAELVDHVVGVDPDRDWITVAALDSRTSGVITTDRFPATRDGYCESEKLTGFTPLHEQLLSALARLR